ncbi:tyrosine-protein phosphatase [Carnobacteriaceae bacterium 52-44]
MDKLVNFRDFSEITSNSVVKIKPGKLFRSANFDELSYEIEEYLVDRGVENVIDLRTIEESEIKKYTLTHEGLTYISLPAATLEKDVYDVFFTDKLDKHSTSDEIRDAAYFVHGTYNKMPFNNDALRFVFEEMRDKGSSLLFHCSSGKDRTGIVTALILKMFGVEENIIFPDYLKSNESLVEGLNRYSWEMDYDEEQHDALMWASKVHSHLLEETFETILEKYDNFECYFDEEYGVSEEDISKIKETYLEN